ncbi:lytic transglycosylase domain-containing protein [Shiella aurantiaca]|nr:LysM peptidoglycan-binding domain-containing protein [Shiella aurantiaca]
MMNKGRIFFLFVCLSVGISTSLKAQSNEELVMEEDTASMEVFEAIDSTQLIATTYSYDYIPDFSDEEIKARLEQIEGEIPLTYNERVRSFIDYFTVRDREYTRKMLERKDVYFPLFEKYLKQYGLPDELKYLAIVESGLNPKAISRASAVGLWQFMSPTARIDYKLKIDWFVDERMDPEKATEAACKYLAFLYRSFNDWELALAAYNTGPGNIRKAIRRSGGKKTFWGIYNYIHRDTRAYVPQFIAVTYAMNFAEEHNLFPEKKLYSVATDTILVSNFVNLKTFSQVSGVCYEDLVSLNPSIKRGVLPDYTRNFALIVPADKALNIRANRYAILDSAAFNAKEQMEALTRFTPGSTYGREKVYYKVRSGDVLGSIAQKYHVRVSDIREWNRLSGNLIRVGQTLAIYVEPGMYGTPTKTTASARPIPANKVHTVQPGDTLWKISKQYEGLTIEKLKQLNNLKDSNIKAGQKLFIG